MITRTLSLIFSIIVTAFTVIGCHSSSSSTTADPSGFVEFKDRSAWSFTKQQRWNDIQKYMSENATSFVRDSQGAAIAYARNAGLSSAAQLQSYLDGFESRRTGNSNAHSCRVVTALNKPYDFTRCTQKQLTAELFEQSEELHGFI